MLLKVYYKAAYISARSVTGGLSFIKKYYNSRRSGLKNPLINQMEHKYSIYINKLL